MKTAISTSFYFTNLHPFSLFINTNQKVVLQMNTLILHLIKILKLLVRMFAYMGGYFIMYISKTA